MESFEGLKAYRTPGRLHSAVPPPDKNAQRTINTFQPSHCARVARAPVEDFVQAVKAIVSDQDRPVLLRAPAQRPVRLSSLPSCILGVRTSRTHKFIIVCSPVGAYYSTGINPVKTVKMSIPVPARAAPASQVRRQLRCIPDLQVGTRGVEAESRPVLMALSTSTLRKSAP